MADDDLFASPKSRLTTLLLSAMLGVFGAHRFYVGKTGTGLAMLFTLGGMGLWYVYDLVMISTGSFRDSNGLLVTNWEQDNGHIPGTLTAASVLDELDALRAEVNELHERVDFAERMLGDPARSEKRAP